MNHKRTGIVKELKVEKHKLFNLLSLLSKPLLSCHSHFQNGLTSTSAMFPQREGKTSQMAQKRKRKMSCVMLPMVTLILLLEKPCFLWASLLLSFFLFFSSFVDPLCPFKKRDSHFTSFSKPLIDWGADTAMSSCLPNNENGWKNLPRFQTVKLLYCRVGVRRHCALTTCFSPQKLAKNDHVIQLHPCRFLKTIVDGKSAAETNKGCQKSKTNRKNLVSIWHSSRNDFQNSEGAGL